MKARELYLHHKTKEKLLRLKKEAEIDGAYRVAKRLHAVILNSQGNRSGKISALLQAPRSCVIKWLSDYEKEGIDSLLEGYRTGRPGRLNKKQKESLSDIIDSGPISYGYISGIWTSIMIKDVIKEEFSVNYHPGHVRKLLKEMGFSVQRPKKVLAKADPVKQNKWLRYTYPRIKKKQNRSEQA